MRAAAAPLVPRRRFPRWWWWLAALLILLPAIALVVLRILFHSFTHPPLDVAFAGRALPAQSTIEMPGGREIFIAETGRTDGPLVVFVHGTPGSWMDFLSLMTRPELADRALLVGMDRLGWGGSAAGGIAPSLEMQAAAVAAVLRARPQNRPAILVGHSLGGAVISRAAMDSPSLVAALVIVAGSIDPAQERTAWYQSVARSPFVRWAIPEPLVRSADELAGFRSELERMLPHWSSLRMGVTVVQGEDDALVPPANADFAQRVMTSAQLTVERVPRQGHLIPWQRPELISDAVLRSIEELQRNVPEKRRWLTPPVAGSKIPRPLTGGSS